MLQPLRRVVARRRKVTPDSEFKVYFAAARLYPSWTAWRQWEKGRLLIRDAEAEFRPDSGGQVVVSSGVSQVVRPWRAVARAERVVSVPTDTWIEVRYWRDGVSQSVFLNDARLGFLSQYLLFGRHTELVSALDRLVVPS